MARTKCHYCDDTHVCHVLPRTVSELATFLGQHRAKNDTLDQNVDSWYCTCNGIRQYRSQAEVEEHIAQQIFQELL